MDSSGQNEPVNVDGNIEATRLVEAIGNGQVQLEAEFVKRYRESVRRILERLSGDHGRAEDLTHDVLIILLRKLRSRSLRDPTKLSSYVFQTARFVYLGWLRKSDSHLEYRHQIDDFGDQAQGMEEVLLRIEASDLLCQSIRQLPVERDQEILLRYYLVEQTKSEICEVLLLSSAQYNRVLSRARIRLKSCLVDGLAHSGAP
jgi:RNA polymerase sigma factor (sigma-70 family)